MRASGPSRHARAAGTTAATEIHTAHPAPRSPLTLSLSKGEPEAGLAGHQRPAGSRYARAMTSRILRGDWRDGLPDEAGASDLPAPGVVGAIRFDSRDVEARSEERRVGKGWR